MAQEASGEELAKKSRNPVGDIISLPLENNIYFDVGQAEEWAKRAVCKARVSGQTRKTELDKQVHSALDLYGGAAIQH